MPDIYNYFCLIQNFKYKKLGVSSTYLKKTDKPIGSLKNIKTEENSSLKVHKSQINTSNGQNVSNLFLSSLL